MSTREIVVICPACSKKGSINLNTEKINSNERGITAVNIPLELICTHSFIAYIDKNFMVRDCFSADFVIQLPQIKIQNTEFDLNFDLDLIKLNFHAITFFRILRTYFSNTKTLFLNEISSLNRHFNSFVDSITHNDFPYDFLIETPSIYEKNKKQYKKYTIFDRNKIIGDKSNIFKRKKNKVEEKIIEKFLNERNLRSSHLIIKNEVQKAFILGKFIQDFVVERNITKKVNYKIIKKEIEVKYNIEIEDFYLEFIKDLVYNFFEIRIETYDSLTDFI